MNIICGIRETPRESGSVEASLATIARLSAALDDANALYNKMSAERSALDKKLAIALRRLGEIGSGAAFKPALHARAGIMEINAIGKDES